MHRTTEKVRLKKKEVLACKIKCRNQVPKGNEITLHTKLSFTRRNSDLQYKTNIDIPSKTLNGLGP